MRQLIDRAEKAGAVIALTRKHVHVRCPNGALVILASSSRSIRGVANARAALRRIGGLDL